MALSVGDVVLTFLGDTTQLDKAFDKVNSTSASKLDPAKQSIQGLDTSFLNAGRSGQRAGDQIAEAGSRSRRSIQEARGTVDLLGDQLGIRIPRELKSVIANSNLASGALTAAFKATAVLAFIAVIAEVTDKVTKWVGETFIMNDALRASDEAIKTSNASLAGYADKLRESREALEQLGLTGARLAAKELEELQKRLTDSKKQFADLQPQVAQANKDVMDLQQGWKGWGSAIGTVFDKTIAYFKGVEVPEKQRIAAAEQIRSQYTKLGKDIQLMETQVAQASTKTGTAEISEQQNVLDSRHKTEIAKTNLAYQQERQRLQDQGLLNSQGGALELSHQETLYQIELRYQQSRLVLLRRDPTKDPIAIRTQQQQIEQLQADHDAKLLKMQIDLENKIMGLSLRQLPQGLDLQSKFDTGADAADRLANSLYRVGEAFQILGIESQSSLAKAVDDDRLALDALTEAQQRGEVSTHQLDQAKLKLIQDEIKLAQVQGKSTVALQASEREVKQRLTPTLQQNATAWLQLAATTGAASGSIGQFAQAMARAILQSIASYAITKGVEQLALGFAALSPVSPDFGHSGEHFVSSGLWFSLAGASTAAGSFLQGGSPGSVTNPVSTTPDSAAVQPQQNPVNKTNVQHFAMGGLVSQPTLAIVGDARGGGSSRKGEGILPLDDDDAMNAIAGEIADRIGSGGGNHITVHVKNLTHSGAVTELARNLTRAVNRGSARLSANETRRVIRRT